MLFVARLQPLRAAQAFADHLRSLNIEIRLDIEQEAGVLYAAHERDLGAVKQELAAFIADPGAPKYQAASWQSGQPHAVPMRGGLDLRHWRSRAGLMTMALVAVSILLTLLTGFGDQPLTKQFFISTTAQGLPELLSGQLYRLITPIFLHFMLLHLLFNMMWLWDLGGSLERRFSGLYLVTFVFLTGALSNLAQFIAAGPAFGGMSGVVYALLGFVWLRGRLDPASGFHVANGVVGFMLVWLIVCFTGWLGPVANAAHLAGLIAGAGWGALSAFLKK